MDRADHHRVVIGDVYDVTFWMAARNGDVGGNNSNPVSVILDDSVTLMPPTLAPSPAWEYYTTASFVATSTTNTIRFQTSQTGIDSANLLDDVHIGHPSMTPGPSAALVFAPSLLSALKRRRRVIAASASGRSSRPRPRG